MIYKEKVIKSIFVDGDGRYLIIDMKGVIVMIMMIVDDNDNDDDHIQESEEADPPGHQAGLHHHRIREENQGAVRGGARDHL